MIFKVLANMIERDLKDLALTRPKTQLLMRLIKSGIYSVIITGFTLAASTLLQPVGDEYKPVGELKGARMSPAIALNGGGGYLVWHDNAVDGDGNGVAAVRFNGNFSPALGSFRVNQITPADQENAKVAILKNGGAVFVWQGGVYGYQKIYARFLASDGTFLTGDIQVNSYTNEFQVDPVVTCLDNGNVVIVWSSYGQDGDKQGVYFRILSPDGTFLSDETQVNLTTYLNQRSPSVVSIGEGKFVVVWISEKYLGKVSGTLEGEAESYSINVFGRIFGNNGTPQTQEIQISKTTNTCANPFVSKLPSGGFMVAWSENFGLASAGNTGWDVVAKCFTSSGDPGGPAIVINQYRTGNQYGPVVAIGDSGGMIVWTSYGQDSSLEGVYGRYITTQGVPEGDEFLVNSTVKGSQSQPFVASDGHSKFLVVWTSYVPGANVDLFARQYSIDQALDKPEPPYVYPVSSSRLSVVWEPIYGFDSVRYELYIDDSTQPIILTNVNQYVLKNLAPQTSHSVKYIYVLPDGRRSPLSDAAIGTTYGEDDNADGLPDDWQEKYWGPDPALWPSPEVDSDHDGASNRQEFLSGTDPTDPQSVLKLNISSNSMGRVLTWNTVQGCIYQIQSSSDMKSWENVGSPRLARGNLDFITLNLTNNNAFFRVIRIR